MVRSFNVIASAAKQSIYPARSSGLLRYARNDEDIAARSRYSFCTTPGARVCAKKRTSVCGFSAVIPPLANLLLTTSAIILKLFLLCSNVSGRLFQFPFRSFPMDRVQPGYVQLVLHDDENTPQDFVIGLLRSVFSLSPTDAVEVMITIEKRGKAVCGTYPRGR